MYTIGQWIEYPEHQRSKRYEKNSETTERSIDRSKSRKTGHL